MKDVLVIIGSESDTLAMEPGLKLLSEKGMSFELQVLSAHRNLEQLISFLKQEEASYRIVIAAAGLSAALPGVVASLVKLPVIGIPIHSPGLGGHDALFSIVQMPPGVPVAAVAIDGGKNAAILAAQILALKYPALKARLKSFKTRIAKA